MKRIFDLIVVFLLLPLVIPVLLAVLLLVWLKLGFPVLFIQVRPGKCEQLFSMYKIRTMTDSRDSNGSVLPDEKRLTKLGILLRSTSLDELPSLWNVLKGDMSLVGPRPLLIEYLPLYNKEQRRRHNVRPGITGWAQVNGRNATTWPERFKLDIWYVDNRSMWLDIKILWMTIKKVVMRDGISQDGHVTMEKFKGV